MKRRLTTLTLITALAIMGGGAGFAAEGPKAAAGQKAASAAKPAAKRVDINTASRAELRALPGISDVDVDRIVKARPYLSKATLVSAKVLSVETYQGLTGRIVAIPPASPAKSKP